jgi:hypothetical protein
MCTVAKAKQFPSMHGNGAAQSVIFVGVGLFFHACTKLTLSGAFLPWLF